MSAWPDEQFHQVKAALGKVKEYFSTGGDKLSESDTRAFFIDPLVAALGYTTFSDVVREQFVKDSKEYLDYLLKVGGQPRVAVEAKAISKVLTDMDAAQLIQYCAILGVEWGVVTNGAEWWLYHQFAKTDLAGKLVFKLDLTDWTTDAELQAIANQLLLVSKQAFTETDGPAAWLRAQRLDEVLRDALTNPRSPEVKFLRDQAASHDVLATVEDVAAWAKSKLLDPTPSPSAETVKPVAAAAAVSPSQGTKVGQSSSAPIAEAVNYWILPAGAIKGLTSMQSLKYWLDSGKWGLKQSTPQRKDIKPGDLIAFYAAGKPGKPGGIVARARADGLANLAVTQSEWPEPTVMDSTVYKLPLADIEWLSKPLVITETVRSQLDAFKGKDPKANWAWLVQTTRRISQDDYSRLVIQGGTT